MDTKVRRPPGGGVGMLAPYRNWLAALGLCLLAWLALGDYQDDHRRARMQRAELAVSAEIATDIHNRRTTDLTPRLRALLQRPGIGFAFLRVYDARGAPVAAAGRFDRPPLLIQRALYGMLSSPHEGRLVLQGANVGRIEYGLMIGSGGTGPGVWRLWFGLGALLVGLPWFWLTSIALVSDYRRDWMLGGSQTVREVTAARSPAAAPTEDREHAGTLMAAFDRGTLQIDRQLRVIHLNDLAARLTGWQPREATGHLLPEVLPLFGAADAKKPVALPVLRVLSGEAERVQEDLHVRRRGGGMVRVTLAAAPVRDTLGAITGAMITMSPATSAPGDTPTAAQETPPAGNAALSLMLLDQLLESVVTTDSQDRIRFANRRALENFGYTLAELQGQHISCLLPVPFLQPERARLADLAAGKAHGDMIAKRRDGTQFPAVIDIQRVNYRDRQANVVTIRKADLAQPAVRLGAALRQLVDRSTDEILVIDAHSLRVLEVNGHALRNLGYESEKLRSKNLLEFAPSLTAESFQSFATMARLEGQEALTHRVTLRRANGSEYEAEVRLSHHPLEKPPLYVLTSKDLSASDLASARGFDEERLNFLAYHDSLTGLPSRLLFMDRLRAASAQSRDTPGFAVCRFAVAVADVREVNERLGYEAGDQLLRATADRLGIAVERGDSVARDEGAAYLLLLNGISGPAAAEKRVERLVRAFAKPLDVGGQPVTIGVHAGATLWPADDSSADELVAHADAALRAARSAGRSYDLHGEPPPLAVMAEPSATSAVQLLRQLDSSGQLALDLQPIIDVRSRLLVAAEVFLHWQHPQRGVIRTAAEIRAAEPLPGLAAAVGEWLFNRALEQYRAWHDLDLPSVPLVFNASALELQAFAAAARGLVARHQIASEKVILAVNAEGLEHLFTEEGRWLRELRDVGLRLCVDDLDPGQVDMLRRLDADVLRLTPRATAGLGGSDDAYRTTQAIVDAGRRVGVLIAANCIDQGAQERALTSLGCYMLQGRLYGDVMTSRDFARMLARSEVASI